MNPLPEKTIRIYEASAANLNPVAALVAAYREIYYSRTAIWHLFKRDFTAGFRQQLLGYLWIVITPLIGIVSFVFMQKAGILNPGEMPMPYPIYVFMGTTIWGLFMSSLGAVSNGLINNSDLVMRTNIPKIGLALMGMAKITYSLLVNIVVLLVLLIFFRTTPSYWALLYPLAVLPIMFLGIGFGLMLSVVGAVARDVTGVCITLITLVMYITPVAYTPDFKNSTIQSIMKWNPMTYLVDSPRSLFITGELRSGIGYLGAALLALFILWMGAYAFYLIKDKVAERL